MTRSEEDMYEYACLAREIRRNSKEGMIELGGLVEAILEEQGHSAEYIDKYTRDTDWDEQLSFLNKHGEL